MPRQAERLAAGLRTVRSLFPPARSRDSFVIPRLTSCSICSSRGFFPPFSLIAEPPCARSIRLHGEQIDAANPESWPTIESLAKAQLEIMGQRGVKLVVMEAGMLVEAGWSWADEVWLVACDPELQAARLAQRDSLTREAAQQRLAAQAQKHHQPDVTIINDRTATAKRQITRACRALLRSGLSRERLAGLNLTPTERRVALQHRWSWVCWEAAWQGQGAARMQKFMQLASDPTAFAFAQTCLWSVNGLLEILLGPVVGSLSDAIVSPPRFRNTTRSRFVAHDGVIDHVNDGHVNDGHHSRERWPW